MPTDGYQYAVSFSDAAGKHLAQVAIEVDWVPAHECVKLDAFLADHRDPPMMPIGAVAIDPIWDTQCGEPILAGFRASLRHERHSYARTFATRYFKMAVEEASANLVKNRIADKGEQVSYQICAFRSPSKRSVNAATEVRFDVEEVAQPLPLQLSDLDTHLASSKLYGAVDPQDIPVFIPSAVLEEIICCTDRAGPLETGGVLVGVMCRDLHRPEILFLRISAQIPATDTQAESHKLTFTAETWTAAKTAIRLRGGNERMLGFWHSHPQRYWCASCPPERRTTCPMQSGNGFFSTDDCLLHRAVFPQACSIALLASNLDSGIKLAAFGWRKGLIESRGFHVSDAAASFETAEGLISNRGSCHDNSC